MKVYPAIIFLFSITAFAQQPGLPIPANHFILNKAGVALDGFDAVSYFNKMPLEGKAEFAPKHEGVIHRFASEINKETFKKEPDKYVPEYGGWCAYVVGNSGEKVEPDFENFKIVDGKINLFYKNFFTNILGDWNKDEANLHNKALKNWHKIVAQSVTIRRDYYDG